MDLMKVLPPMDVDWWQFAECKGMDPNIFVTERGQDVSLAKSVCRTCPVREPCLAYADADWSCWGVWGGTCHNERWPKRKRLAS